VAGLEPKEIRRIQIRRESSAVLLERRGETGWRFLEGGTGEAKAARVDDVLYMLRTLKWKEIATPKTDDPGKFGLKTPAAEFGLYRDDGTAIETVAVSKPEGERLYAKLGSRPTVYVVDASLVQIPTLDEF
jgi:hypothetical protein